MGITKANLYAKAIEMGARAAREAVGNVGDLVDASEQLTRAGIDLLKSGFSRFGFALKYKSL